LLFNLKRKEKKKIIQKEKERGIIKTNTIPRFKFKNQIFNLSNNQALSNKDKKGPNRGPLFLSNNIWYTDSNNFLGGRSKSSFAIEKILF